MASVPFLDGGTPPMAPATDSKTPPSSTATPTVGEPKSQASQNSVEATTIIASTDAKDHITTTHKSPDREKPSFLSLPPELREMIYEYAFSGTLNLTFKSYNPNVCNQALLYTCRQVYQEGLKLYYRNATFTFHDGSDGCFVKWYERLSPQARRWIRDIRWDRCTCDFDCAMESYFACQKLQQTVREVVGQAIADGVLKTCFAVGKGDRFWYSVDQVFIPKDGDADLAFEEFYDQRGGV